MRIDQSLSVSNPNRDQSRRIGVAARYGADYHICHRTDLLSGRFAKLVVTLEDYISQIKPDHEHQRSNGSEHAGKRPPQLVEKQSFIGFIYRAGPKYRAKRRSLLPRSFSDLRGDEPTVTD